MEAYFWMKFSLFLICLLASGLFTRLSAQSRLIDSCDITWSSPSHNSGESMPVGGGDIGCNVWVENGDLLFYFARTGSFDENNALLKGGRVRLHLTPSLLTASPFRQQLHLADGSVYIDAGQGSRAVHIHLWVDVHQPVIHLSINSARPLQAEAAYESWRYTDRIVTGKATSGTSWKWAGKHAPDGKVIARRDSISFDGNDVLFLHHNLPPTVFDVTVHQQGLDPVKTQIYNPLQDLCFGGRMRGEDMYPAHNTQGKYIDTDFKGWTLKSKHAATSRDLTIYLATTKGLSSWQDSLQKLIATENQREALTADKNWWSDFWQQSFIYIPDSIGTHTRQWQMGRNYQVFRYMLGCNAYGEWPTKFNGGLFTVDPVFTDTSLHATPDHRNWGGGTMTAQNQRLVYFPLLKTGDTTLLHAQLETYLRLLPAARLRTKIYWGHEGASFTEQMENFGLPNTAEYGWDMPADHDKGVEYNAWLEYLWDTELEFCWMALEEERYTGQPLKRYLPLVESCLQFFFEHYQYLAAQRGRKSLDGNGHLILYPGSGAETFKMAYNSSSTIAGLHAILTRLLELPYLSDTARKKWTTMLAQLPPLSYRQFDGHTTIAPAQAWARVNNIESPQLYPVFPWGIYGIGKPGLDTAINTYKYDTDVIRFRSPIGWKQDNIWAARLGITADAASLTVAKLQDGPRRFPAFWGPGFDWTPDHNWGGSGMIGLQEMLLQADGKKIYLFPAWPKEWDVHFKLHAPYSTTVEATLHNGKITTLKVEPASREKDIITNF